MRDAQSKTVKKLEAMINVYYFLVFSSALILFLAALSSLLVYQISSILTPVLFCIGLLGILCCILRFLQIQDVIEHCPLICKADSNRKNIAKHIGPWFTAEILLIILGIYPLFPFWLKALFRAPALALLLCLLLWGSKAYRKYTFYS